MDCDIPPARPAYRDDFEVAIICALQREYDAVIAVLDGRWNDHGDPYGKVDNDQNTYTTGWIGNHNVVLALLSDMGKINATSVATSLALSFSKVKLAFLVGICGAVPQTADGVEIVLGDVIVSQHVVEYDFGKRYSDTLRLKDKLVGGFGHQQSHNARRYMATMQTDHYCRLIAERTLECLRAAQENYPGKYECLQMSEDKLFPSTYRHMHQAQMSCDICERCVAPSDQVCDNALSSTCEELGCDDSHIIHRTRLAGSNTQRTPLVHWGAIASGDTVMKCAMNRDAIARHHNVIGFEMEGAGVCDNFPCIIVKGACDYADSHKSQMWQNYAAITAACAMKALMQWYPRTDQRHGADVSAGGHALISKTQARQSAISDTQIVDAVAKLRQQNQDLQAELRQMRALLQERQALPFQVPSRDLVSVNDALGETYSFPITFVDSLEFFMTILRHKFKDVGVGKIERGEWLLQNRRTGHVLNLNRPWKAVVKPGQILDMSMIFKKRNILSTQCPWCESENQSDAQDQYIDCIQCSGKYRRIEEIYDIVLAEDNVSQKEDTAHKGTWPLDQRLWVLLNRYPMFHRGRLCDKDEDIHLFTRVQIIDIDFRFSWPEDDNNKSQQRQIIVRIQDLKNFARLAREITNHCRLPGQDFLDVAQKYYDEILIWPRPFPISTCQLLEELDALLTEMSSLLKHVSTRLSDEMAQRLRSRNFQHQNM